MKILVVDDDREIVELLSIYLRNEKFEIVKAYDGKQALEKIQAYPDIDMDDFRYYDATVRWDFCCA